MVSEKDGMKQVFIPEGEFMMGADRSVGYKACQELFQPYNEYYTCYEHIYEKEEPVHHVWLDEYWMDQTEVTNAMYADFLNEHGNKYEWGIPWLDESDPRGLIKNLDGIWIVEPGYEKHPVTLVTWYGANAYCLWMGRRLPTEAEWEKAARGTIELIYPWGNEFDGTKLNFNDLSNNLIGDNRVYDGGYALTSPVGIYPQGASPYGVLDMAGNVIEWVFDRFDANYYGVSPYENPEGPADSYYDIRVRRGGSWVNPGSSTRTTGRFGTALPAYREIDTGFRCVMSE